MDYKAELDRASFALRDKVGKVLSSGSEIIALKDRAAYYRATNNAQVNGMAEAVVSKAGGLLTNYKSIEANSITVLGEANAMRTKMETDPLWKAIQAGNYGNVLGWESLARAKDAMGQAAGLISRAASLSKRAQDHLDAVADLRDDENELENFAQGKGIRSVVSGALSFGSNYLSFAKYAAIGVGLFFVWDIAKPLLVARRRK